MWNCMKKFFTVFCTESSVHGVKYLIKDKNVVSRCYWCFILIFSVFCCGEFTILLSRRFLEIPTQMTIKNKQALTVNLTLPSITFCVDNPSPKELLLVYEEFLDNITLPQEYTRNLVLDAIRYAVGELSPRYEQVVKDLNATLLLTLDKVLQFNRIKPRDFMNRVSVACHVLLRRCQLRGRIVPCAEIFKRVRGQCCTFTDNAKEFRSFGYVFGNNLIVSTTMNYGDSYFMVHNADSEPIIDQSSFTMNNEFYIMFYTEPMMTLKSEEVQKIEKNAGGCVHPNERKLRYFNTYNFHNCIAEWTINYSMVLCDCAATYFPAPDEFTCNFTQINCFGKHPNINKRIFSELVLKPEEIEAAKHKGIEIWTSCPNTCEFMAYTHNFKPRKLVPSYDYTGFLDGVDPKNEYVVQFNYESQFYTVVEHVPVIDWITLLSNLGGVYGLFLGCSMLTLAELIYYFWSTVISKMGGPQRSSDDLYLE